MKRIWILALISFFLLVPALRAQTISQIISRHLYDSVALLFTQGASGNMQMTCSVTAFSAAPAKNSTSHETVYRFASAAHCVEGSSDRQQKLQKFYISADAKGTKVYLPAKLIQTGDKTLGDDFSLFEITTTEKFEIIPLGESDSLQMGDAVIDISGALGMGKQYFQGYISEVHLDRPPLNAGSVQWTDIILVQIGGAPGSSGSAIVSLSQKAIVGFLVGNDNQGDIGKICIPVSKFSAFVKAVDAGTYKKTKKTDENADSDSDSQKVQGLR